jgi:hypothetical protein
VIHFFGAHRIYMKIAGRRIVEAGAKIETVKTGAAKCEA